MVKVLVTMTWCAADSLDERFATARAVYVAGQQHNRRPGATLTGFLQALAKLPLAPLRALANGMRARLAQEFVEPLRIGGYVPLACDGTRVECPRAAPLQRHLGEAGKPDSAPMLYLTTLVLLPLGLPWAWRWGKGTANEHEHLRHLLPTLPERSLVVGDAFYMGYELLTDILQRGASFLVRLSSRTHLYTLTEKPLHHFREGLVYYWPQDTRAHGKRASCVRPLRLRLLRVRGKKADVWLLTNVLDRKKLSRGSISQIYRWRWRNEGMFRVYKRTLRKTKLQSRTMPLVHREAEGSMLALQVMLAMASTPARQMAVRPHQPSQTDSPRRTLLRLRSSIAGALRSLGPRQFASYCRDMQKVRSQQRPRISPKTRQHWPRKKEYKPPGPPQLRKLPDNLRCKLTRMLRAA